MIKQLFKVVKQLCFGTLVLASENLSAQTAVSREVVKDSMDRYGAFGLRPGTFYNLKQDNQFTANGMGVFLDYNFGKFRHSIEIDFLTKSYSKFFRNAYSPCLTYNFSIKKQLKHKIELLPGGFINCRKDVVNRKALFASQDSLKTMGGNQTIFSIGPSVELNRRVFFSGKNNFLILGARMAYSFDIIGLESKGKIPASKRHQRDALTLTLKIGWGKLIQPERMKTENDPELRIITY